MPPAAVTLALPLLPPKQLTEVADVAAVKGKGAKSEKVVVSGQDAPELTVTVYGPGAKPEIVCVVSPVDQI